MRIVKLCAGLLLAFLLCSSLLLAQDAQTLFKAKCAKCHGLNADGKTTMGERMQLKDLRAPEIQKLSDAELTQDIVKGKGKMPPQGAKITKEQMPAMILYIRELAKK